MLSKTFVIFVTREISIFFLH